MAFLHLGSYHWCSSGATLMKKRWNASLWKRAQRYDWKPVHSTFKDYVDEMLRTTDAMIGVRDGNALLAHFRKRTVEEQTVCDALNQPQPRNPDYVQFGNRPHWSDR